jgi:hypothetical protein
VTAQSAIFSEGISDDEPYAWIGRVLTNFAIAEQAIGRLCLELDFPISNGSLTKLAELRDRLRQSPDRKCQALEKRIERWTGNRPFRHLLAHSTVSCLTDAAGGNVVVTRHLPRDVHDVTPDRNWTRDERQELLRQAANDGRSIHDHVKGLLADSARLAKLRQLP